MDMFFTFISSIGSWVFEELGSWLLTLAVGLMLIGLGAFALVQRQIDVVRITQARNCVRLPNEDSEF